MLNVLIRKFIKISRITPGMITIPVISRYILFSL
jgi:hypothetical protein